MRAVGVEPEGQVEHVPDTADTDPTQVVVESETCDDLPNALRDRTTAPSVQERGTPERSNYAVFRTGFGSDIGHLMAAVTQSDMADCDKEAILAIIHAAKDQAAEKILTLPTAANGTERVGIVRT